MLPISRKKFLLMSAFVIVGMLAILILIGAIICLFLCVRGPVAFPDRPCLDCVNGKIPVTVVK
jgi:NADH:ubiquinone oxidoreductase subunit 6 (subunit J)